MYPELETYEEDTADREDAIVLAKARGKGAPKKKRTAEGEFSCVFVWRAVRWDGLG